MLGAVFPGRDRVLPASGCSIECAVDFGAIWRSCLRKLRSWPTPTTWSERDWLEEMKAEAAVTVLKAVRDFRPDLNVPLLAYVRMRVMGQLLAVYRREWRHSRRQAPDPCVEPPSPPGGECERAAEAEELGWAIARLDEEDRRLLQRLFWGGETETQVAASLGVSQQMINKRKAMIVRAIRDMLVDRAGNGGISVSRRRAGQSRNL